MFFSTGKDLSYGINECNSCTGSRRCFDCSNIPNGKHIIDACKRCVNSSAITTQQISCINEITAVEPALVSAGSIVQFKLIAPKLSGLLVRCLLEDSAATNVAQLAISGSAARGYSAVLAEPVKTVWSFF